MATAIRLHNAKNTIVRNCYVSGFNKGIEAINSDVLLSNNKFQKCGVGLELINSKAVVHNSYFMDNVIDIVVNKSKAQLIDSLARRILAILPNGEIRINPYVIRNMAIQIINTRDIQEKRSRLRKLLRYLKKYSHVWTIYSILKEIARLAGYPI